MNLNTSVCLLLTLVLLFTYAAPAAFALAAQESVAVTEDDIHRNGSIDAPEDVGTQAAFAATAAGADGIMVEVHNNPSCALCDGAQSLTPQQFQVLSGKVQKIREAIL